MAMMGDDVEQRTLEPRYDGNGKVWVWAYHEAGATKDTPGMIQFFENGYRYVAMADNTNWYYVGVPDETVASGVWEWEQIGGFKQSMITASLSMALGHALYITGGAVADKGADFTFQPAEFAVCETASTSAAIQDVLLYPRIIHAET